jgi:hypothetical protein
MTDNFNRFKEFMRLPETEGGDAYYVIELVRRGKDCPDLPAANYHFKNYYIDSMQKYDKVQDEIRLLCRTLRLRAYVSVNRKSFRRVTMDTIAEMSRRAALDDFRRPYAVFESCSGKFVDKNDEHWVVDVDDFIGYNTQEHCVTIRNFINDCRPYGDKIELMLPTKSGMHLITRPFDLNAFNGCMGVFTDWIPRPEVKKNHLTLLFEDL